MQEHDRLVVQFEEHRVRLRAIAYRMLGSLSEAEDAVQETWIRLSRTDTADVQDLRGWLTTVVGRVCLDMLRSRTSRREVPLDGQVPELIARRADIGDPEQEAILADSVGLALLVVLEALAPAERLAFVLHDVFAVPFAEIAPIVGRSPAAARMLASRARRRVHGAAVVSDADLARQRTVVDAFLAASRAGDFDALIALLDPEVVFRADESAAYPGVAREARGAVAVARRSLAARGGGGFAVPALVNGVVGVVAAPLGRLSMVLRFTVARGKIVEIEAVADPKRLRRLEIAVLDG